MRIATCVLALAAAATAIPAIAANRETTETVAVRYNDLDLTTASGKSELDRRLDRAARQVCNIGEATTGSRITMREGRECYREARGKLDQHFATIVASQAREG